MIKKSLLATLSVATSLLAITQEQQMELDRIFAEQRAKIEKQNLNYQSKDMALRLLENQKREIESKSDEEIAKYLANGLKNDESIKTEKKESIEDEEALGDDEKPLIDESTLVRSDGWLGWAFGATGFRYAGFIGGNSGGAYMIYGTIGPKYNFSNKGSSLFSQKGFSLSVPIGFGAINTSGIKNDMDFVLPVGLEMTYFFSDDLFKFGLNVGIRYSFSPQEIGSLHFMDFYAGIDFTIFHIEAGYVFYSSQDVKVGNKTISTDPLSGAFSVSIGLRF